MSPGRWYVCCAYALASAFSASLDFRATAVGLGLMAIMMAIDYAAEGIRAEIRARFAQDGEG